MSRISLWRNDIREYEAACLIAQLIGKARKVLNVGPSWGRDYYALKERGKQVVNLDIAPQRHLSDIITADAARSFPFPDGSFDAVLLPEVLEHLVEDWLALREAHRVLKDDGCLVVTVPFYSDASLYHIRIHSPKSIMRLLATAGFSTERTIYRGGWIRAPRLVHVVRKCLTPFKLSRRWYRLVVAMDLWWGEQPWSRFLSAGAYILAHKSEELDFRRINVEEFQH